MADNQYIMTHTGEQLDSTLSVLNENKGTNGQVLSSDGTSLTWTNPAGSDENAIKKNEINIVDGSFGIKFDYQGSATESSGFYGETSSGSQYGFFVQRNGNKPFTMPGDVLIKIGSNPTVGQVLAAADSDGKLKWVDQSGGGVSGDYLPLNLSTNTEVNGNGSSLTFSNGDVIFNGNIIANSFMKFGGDRFTINADNARETVTIETNTADLDINTSSNPITVTGPTTFNNPVTVPTPTANGHAANKQYVDSNFPLSPTVRNIQVVSALPGSPDANTLYLITG